MTDRDAFERFMERLEREARRRPPKKSWRFMAEYEEHHAPPVHPAIEEFVKSTERRP